VRWLPCVAVIAIGAGCAGTQPTVRPDDAPAAPGEAAAGPALAPPEAPAPLDPEIAALPNARGSWMLDPEFGGVYVVTVGPAGAPGAAAAPPLLLVHGLGTNGMRDFYPVLAPLAVQRRVIMLDLPGFGRSGRNNVKYAPDRYADVLARLIAAHGPGPVDVVGHSMGGAIALFHAAAYPEQVRRLIVVDAAGILHRDAWFGHHLRRVTDPARLVLPRVAEKLGEIAELLTDTSRILDPAPDIVLELAPLRQKLLGGKPERIAALGLILTDFSEVIAHIQAPTLVVWGADDTVAPLRTGLMLADRLRDAELVVFPGIGHQVMAQAPSLLVPQIERHLAAAAAAASKRPSAFGPIAGAQATPPGAVTPAAVTAPAAGSATPAAASKGKGVCSGQSDVVLSGVYDSVVIEDCARITLEQVRTTSVVIRRSTASIIRSTITEGIIADASTLLITGGDLGGEIALDVKDSKVDLAGVAIAARREPFRATGQSRVLTSVCPVRTAASGLRHRHGFVPVAP
jgi:pimeloyl-ACP methyl ester carboxylesterase